MSRHADPQYWLRARRLGALPLESNASSRGFIAFLRPAGDGTTSAGRCPGEMPRTTIERDGMVQRLQDILGRLHRPPADGIRQVFALSRAHAEKLPQLPSIAVISITAPERPPARLGDFAHVLCLSFADVDFLNPHLSERARNKLEHAFSEAQAEAIRAFVSELPDAIKSVVVHCEGGYSRSCAVVVSLHRLYGYHVDAQHLSNANQSIVRMMMGDVRKNRIAAKRRR